MRARIDVCLKKLVTLGNAPASAYFIVGVLLVVSLGRSALEYMRGVLNPDYIQIALVHIIVFYSGVLFLFALVSAFLIPRAVRLNKLLVLGTLIGLLPPLIDLMLPFGDEGRLYKYFVDPVWHFFEPMQAVGESITLWILILGFGTYIFFMSRSWVLGLMGLVSGYALAQFALWGVTEPADYVLGALRDSRPLVSDAVLTQLSVTSVWVLITCAAYTLIRFRYLAATLVRAHHALLFGVLVLLGGALAHVLDAVVVMKAIIFFIAFILVQAENDYYDKELDAKTGRMSSITKDDLVMVRFLMLLLLSVFALIDGVFTIFLALFFMLGLLYHHPSVRMKRHFVTASFLEGLFALLAIASGVYQSKNFVPEIVVYIMLGGALVFALFSNMRDYKDLEGDRVMGIRTLYVLLTEKGMRATMIHAAILFTMGSLATVTFMIAIPHVPVPILIFSGVALFGTILTALHTYTQPRISTTWAIFHANVFLLFLTFIVVPLFRNILI